MIGKDCSTNGISRGNENLEGITLYLGGYRAKQAEAHFFIVGTRR